MGKQKVLELANHIGLKKPGSKDSYTFQDPEYKILEPVVTDEMAQVGIGLAFRQKRTAAQVAELVGMPLAETTKLLLELADAGVAFVNSIDGEDVFWFDLWVPGVMEMMANNLENVKKYPQIAQAFEEYSRLRGESTIGNFPVGVGMMRVIPIETAISGESRRASYEEISKYLNEHTLFSVSDCACRTVREAMGEGCGHLKEDMCIQMGHAAEYYIRTGRGREITREEAFEIIKRAEENGLMHSIPNMDGSGKTHAICNCCGCSCLSLRHAEMYLNTDMVRSNYVSQIDKEKCVACGECVIHCPVNALQLGQKLCSSIPVVESLQREETPRDSLWGKEKWNPDYRINRKNVVDTGTSPCKAECPAHISVQGYIKLASQGKYTEALELIKKNNPFPAVCGRICPHNCETECTRNHIDEPLAIDDIKKFIAQQDLDSDRRYIPRIRHNYNKKIAVIGSGPAGLSCAYYLAIEGYQVTVFEKEQQVGGMLRLGIPAFRLEKDVVDAEIEILRRLGVVFKTGIEIGHDRSIDDLRKDGYSAFYLAVGAQKGRALGLDGEDASGIISGVDFLKQTNLNRAPALSGKVAVIGGGNVAIDVARTAIRAGASQVTLYSLESREEMPALDEEIEEALKENIIIENGWGPESLTVIDGQIHAITFKKCLRVFDKERRFSPVFNREKTRTAPVDFVLLSIGQSIDWGNLLDESELQLSEKNTVIADGFTYQTGQPDVFAGGDCFTGPRFAIDAIAAGKEAAISIHRYVQPGQSLVYGRDRHAYQSLEKNHLQLSDYDSTPRQRPYSPAASLDFSDPRSGLTEEQLKKETERCLSCGATLVDEFLCVGCGQCTTQCKFDAASLVRRYDGAGVSYENAGSVIMKTVKERQMRIAERESQKNAKEIR